MRKTKEVILLLRRILWNKCFDGIKKKQIQTVIYKFLDPLVLHFRPFFPFTFFNVSLFLDQVTYFVNQHYKDFFFITLQKILL